MVKFDYDIGILGGVKKLLKVLMAAEWIVIQPDMFCDREV